jgi:tetratricopeptide (TPR) repeat protein
MTGDEAGGIDSRTSVTNISRCGIARISGVHASDLFQLRAALQSIGLSSRGTDWCVADLSLGAWAAHQAGRSILGQLGEAVGECETEVGSHASRLSRKKDETEAADLIGRLVDAESRGNAATIRALELAERTVESLKRWPERVVLVFAPRFGHVWRPDNLAYLRFLAFGAEAVQAKLVLVAGPEAALPDPNVLSVEWLNTPSPSSQVEKIDTLLGLIPDTPTGTLAQSAGLAAVQRDHFVQLPYGRWLIDPALRRRSSASLRRHFDRLASLAETDPALRAYAQLHGSGYFGDAAFLVGQAWAHFVEGAFDIAVDLMDFAVSCCADPAARGRLLYELQGMRIASLQFEEAGRAPDPDIAGPHGVRGGLLLMKGWGLVMSGRQAQGRTYLAAGKAVLEPSVGRTRQFLYIRNIHALSLARTGGWELALAEEREIEMALDAEEAATGMRDWPLTYVNSLNQARLYKYRQDPERALALYQRGFSTTIGARSESDAVYANFCLAKVHAELGQAREAYVHWLRAGMHWAAARIPEALATRVSSSILNRQVERSSEVVDEISEVLIAEICRAAPADGRSGVATESSPVFRRLNDLETRAARGGATMVGEAGWTVLLDKRDDESPATVSAPNIRLRRLLASLILAAVPSLEPAKAGKVLLPCAGAGEMPATEKDALLYAARLGVDHLIFERKVVLLDEDARQCILVGRRFGLGYAVSACSRGPAGSITVAFKRYRAPIRVTGPAARIVSLLEKPCALRELARSIPELTGDRLTSLLAELETNGVVRSMATPVG